MNKLYGGHRFYDIIKKNVKKIFVFLQNEGHIIYDIKIIIIKVQKKYGVVGDSQATHSLNSTNKKL